MTTEYERREKAHIQGFRIVDPVPATTPKPSASAVKDERPAMEFSRMGALLPVEPSRIDHVQASKDGAARQNLRPEIAALTNTNLTPPNKKHLSDFLDAWEARGNALSAYVHPASEAKLAALNYIIGVYGNAGVVVGYMPSWNMPFVATVAADQASVSRNKRSALGLRD